MATYTVSASTDDADSQSNTTGSGGTGGVAAGDLTNVLLSPGSHGASDFWYVGCRFLNIVVARGATIASASFSMKAQASYSSPGTIKLSVKGQAGDTTVTFGTTAGTNNLGTAARPRTTAASAAWDVKTVTGGTRYSVDVTAVIQEIVNRAGWASGNSIVILVEVDASTTSGEWQDFYSYDDATNRATNPPQLDITVSAGAASLIIPAPRVPLAILAR